MGADGVLRAGLWASPKNGLKDHFAHVPVSACAVQSGG